MKKIFVLIAASFTLSACATIVSGTQQTVFVETPFMEGASCSLVDSKNGIWHIPHTPAATTVTKGNGPLNVTCKKSGYITATTSVDEDLAGATFGNIILGGGIGIFVDAASGAAQKYPDKIIVWMQPNKWSSQQQKKEWLSAKEKYEEDLRQKEEAAKRAKEPTLNQ